MEKVSLTSILLVNHRKSLTDKHFACQQGKPKKKMQKRLVLYQDVQLSLTNVSAIHCFSESLLASAFFMM